MWTFSNPANYTTSNVSLSFGSLSLAKVASTAGDSAQGEFAQALTLDNVDLASSPGDVAVQNTSQPGPPNALVYQANPAQLDDNYLRIGGGGNTNFGASPGLLVGYWGIPEWNRAILHWPALPLPSNATLVSARLELYMYGAATPDAMEISVHQMTTGWTELGSTWNDYDGSNAWNASGGGGDFDPTPIDAVAGITNATGWVSWNVTAPARDWWAGTGANHGILLRQADDDLGIPLGRKDFYSGDAANASLRPRLDLVYTTPSSTGTLESRILGPGISSTWGAIRWNTTLPAGTRISVQTRSGRAPTIDPAWSPWSPPYPSPGAPVVSPAGSYIQYRARLFTPSPAAPVLHDISIDFQHFAPSAVLVTEPFLPADLATWGRVDLNTSGPQGTHVFVAFSQDGGASWAATTPGADLAGVPPRAVSLRITLATDDTTLTPVVRWISLGYALSGDGGLTILYLPVVGPYWLLLIPFLILAAYTLTRTLLRGSFLATDLFLIHSDGRLVLRVGGKESPLRDEHAVSGMFTLVAQFVKDSFRTAEGEGGELKNFQVDDQEVTIARGEFLFLALVGKGVPPREVAGNLAAFVRTLERDEWATLFAWDGFREGLHGIDRGLVRFLRKGYRDRPFFARSSVG